MAAPRYTHELSHPEHFVYVVISDKRRKIGNRVALRGVAREVKYTENGRLFVYFSYGDLPGYVFGDNYWATITPVSGWHSLLFEDRRQNVQR